MTDLTDLSKSALSAAMRGGTEGWGKVGSAQDHIRYSEMKPARPGRRRICYCGCDSPATHSGMANGMALTSACEWGMARWVRTGKVRVAP